MDPRFATLGAELGRYRYKFEEEGKKKIAVPKYKQLVIVTLG
jgi:hypothetical protein